MTSKRKPARDLLVGTWRAVDEFSANVEFTVQKKNGVYTISAVDTYDDEKADIYEEKWDDNKGILSFAGYWNSTGRFMRCRIQLTATDQITFTYTYTDSETMIRKSKPNTY